MPPTQLYATTICNASINLSSCGDESSSTSTSSNSNSETPERPQSGNTETTPLILPDVSPRDEDLGSTVTDGDQDAAGAIGANNDDEDDNNNDNSEDGADGNVDVDRQDDEDSGNDGDESSNEVPSLLPFP